LTGDSRTRLILTSKNEVLFYTQSDNGRPRHCGDDKHHAWYNRSGYRWRQIFAEVKPFYAAYWRKVNKVV
jgi:hypothetical protein